MRVYRPLVNPHLDHDHDWRAKNHEILRIRKSNFLRKIFKISKKVKSSLFLTGVSPLWSPHRDRIGIVMPNSWFGLRFSESWFSDLAFRISELGFQISESRPPEKLGEGLHAPPCKPASIKLQNLSNTGISLHSHLRSLGEGLHPPPL